MVGNSWVGYVTYRSGTDETIKVKLLLAGSEPSDDESTITLKGTLGTQFWGGDQYWGGDVFFGVPFEGRFRREDFDPAGSSEEFQIEVEYEGKRQIEINEIGIRFSSAG